MILYLSHEVITLEKVYKAYSIVITQSNSYNVICGLSNRTSLTLLKTVDF